MDDRKFKLLPEIEYKNIVIMEKRGEVFFVSREAKDSVIIFLKTVEDQSMWFEKEEYPQLFTSFDELYKELGNLDYRLYGYRNTENRDEIFFFDLKIFRAYNDFEWFYHDDFIDICNRFNIPMCHTHVRGEYSLKTIKKLLTKINLGEQDLLFKPTCESNFGIIENSEEAKKVVPFRKPKKQDTAKKEINQQKFFDVIAEIDEPLLFDGNDKYNENSLQQYIEFFTNIKHDKEYIDFLTDEGFVVNYLSRPEITKYLSEYITGLIVEVSSGYLNLIQEDLNPTSIKNCSLSLCVNIKEEVLKAMDILVNRLISKNNIY